MNIQIRPYQTAEVWNQVVEDGLIMCYSVL